MAQAPEDWVCQLHLGAALRALGRAEAALAAYDAAAAVRPDNASLFNNRGNALHDLGRREAAVADFETAARLQPELVLAHVNRARVLIELDRQAAAVESLERALGLEPANTQALFLRGNALMGLGEHAAALDAYEAALHQAPRDPTLHYAKARALVALAYGGASAAAALESYEAALALDPDQPEVLWSRSMALLRLGRFEAGWRDYDRRWQAPRFVREAGPQFTPELLARLTTDAEPGALTGRRVLLVAEQGVGDVLMFASMIPDAMRDAASVALVCEPRLHRLFARAFPGLTLLAPPAPGALLPEVDRVLGLGSLGRLYRNRAADFPGAPYLSASGAVRARWARALQGAGRRRIGVSWRGGLAHTGRRERSLSLAQLRPLLAQPDCAIVSLQYGDVGAEIAAENAGRETPIWLPQPQAVADFEDLAGLVQSLDAVVTVQTAVAHLAGAVGTPCHILVPRRPEWRYGVEATTMPWYRSVTLHRQGADGDWAPVIAEVGRALAGTVFRERDAAGDPISSSST